MNYLLVTPQGVLGKACCDDHMGPAAQQAQRGLQPNLHAATRHQRNATAKVRRLATLGKVEGGTCWAQPVIKDVQLHVVRAADVAAGPALEATRPHGGGGCPRGWRRIR